MFILIIVSHFNFFKYIFFFMIKISYSYFLLYYILKFKNNILQNQFINIFYLKVYILKH